MKIKDMTKDDAVWYYLHLQKHDREWNAMRRALLKMTLDGTLMPISAMAMLEQSWYLTPI